MMGKHDRGAIHTIVIVATYRSIFCPWWQFSFLSVLPLLHNFCILFCLDLSMPHYVVLFKVNVYTFGFYVKMLFDAIQCFLPAVSFILLMADLITYF